SGNISKTEGKTENADRPVPNTAPILSPDELKTAKKPFSKRPFEKLIKDEISYDMRRITAALWFSSEGAEPRFVGHLIFEYSLEKAFMRARSTMIRLIISNVVTGILMMLLLVLATEKFVISPISVLSGASRRIAEGNFNDRISVPSRDEIGELAQHFDEMRVKVKDFTENLQQMVEMRTLEVLDGKRKIQKILIHIEQGILTFDNKNKIDTEFSDFMMRFLELPRESIAGANLFDLIINKTQLSPNDRDQLAASLVSMFDEDEICFMLNSEHLVKETVISLKDSNYIIGLEWTPIIDETTGRISKMMLSIKDLTKQRELENRLKEEKAANTKMMIHISDTIKVGRQKMEQSLKEFDARLLQVDNSLAAADGGNPNGIFIDLHTVKGTARTLGLTLIIEAAHASENFVAKWRSGESYDRKLFLASLDMLKNEIRQYGNTIRIIMGENDAKITGHSVEQHTSSFLSVLAFLVNSNKKHLNEAGLGIKSVTICDEVCDWDETMLQPISDIMVHAFANSVSHGFITPQKKNGRSRDMEIAINARKYGNKAIIEISDNGQGISLERIREIALRNNVPFDETSPYDVLFHNGFSTATDVTHSSGRGVGLSAVRKIANNMGGEADIISSEGKGTTLTISIPIEKILRQKAA
ncbi:MAG: HAMP domain-containing protein, partial [Oligoflexales bacterium]|nr:HAMP domain-containing protein [Oligoflexales bacterium]